MKAPLVPRISPPDLNNLMALLDVEVVALSECVVNEGYRLELGGHEAPGIHYILKGNGRMSFNGAPKIDVEPHTLIVVPPQTPFILESNTGNSAKPVIGVEGSKNVTISEGIRRFRAGDDVDEPEMVMICGYFRAQYGSSTGLFEGLSEPIIEQFTVADRLYDKLNSAVDELLNQEIGAGAMSSALLKQVVVALLRRSLTSINTWVERFALLSDPKVARAFSMMVGNPGANHTVESLAECAFLSRSAFMARFSSIVGKSPMAVLRDLRMRQAAAQLKAGSHTIEAVVANAGYESRSSFVRMFKKLYGVDPSAYRETALAEEKAAG
jgi:AraC family transcriptional activator of mtrCDE